MTAFRIALINIRLVMRTKTVLFFTFVFPLVWLFVFEGIFAHGNPKAVMYFFGPVVTLNIMGSAFWGLGLQSVMQRERGILRRFRLAPISALSLVAANLLANYLLELPTIALLVFFAKFVFHMPLAFGWGTLFILVTVGTFGFAGFGLTIASLANTMQEAQIYNNLVWVTLLFLSGATIPLPLLPHWIQSLAVFLPATYLVTSFQAVMIQAEPLLKHLPEMIALVLSGIFGLLFAWKLFRWEKEEKIPSQAKGWALVFVLPFVLIGLWMTLYTNPTKAWANTYSMLSTGFSGNARGDSSGEQVNLVEDFEGPDLAKALATHWSVSTAPGTNRPLAKLELISPGAEQTSHALQIAGNHDAPEAGKGPSQLVTYHFPDSMDTSQIDSLRLLVLGDGHKYKFQLGQSGSPDDWSETTLVPSAEWQTILIPWDRESSKQGLTHTSGWVLVVSLVGPTSKCSLDIDQVGFIARAGGATKKPDAPEGGPAAK
jgi:ABC-type multidrug transport system permease subunit